MTHTIWPKPQVVDLNTSSLKPAYQIDPALTDSISEYLKGFTHHFDISLGKAYSPEAKDFYAWCEQHLGKKYKDWFVVSNSKTTYRVWCKSSKHVTFLRLKYSESIDNASS